jgi:hypothetical protein
MQGACMNIVTRQTSASEPATVIGIKENGMPTFCVLFARATAMGMLVVKKER